MALGTRALTPEYEIEYERFKQEFISMRKNFSMTDAFEWSQMYFSAHGRPKYENMSKKQLASADQDLRNFWFAVSTYLFNQVVREFKSN